MHALIIPHNSIASFRQPVLTTAPPAWVVHLRSLSSRQVGCRTAKWTFHVALNLSAVDLALAPHPLKFFWLHRQPAPPQSPAIADTVRTRLIRSGALSCLRLMHRHPSILEIHRIDYQNECWFCAQSPPIGLTALWAPTFSPHAPLLSSTRSHLLQIGSC